MLPVSWSAKVGTVPVEKHELLAALSPQMALDAEGRVLTRQELVQRVALWKANSERVIFTNGCFDLLHIGHITLLEQARRCGDRLIVAINSDASVSCLKGPTRPIVSQRERARVLAALAAVDAVVIFDEATPLELIVAVQPDVLVKGGDYRAESVVGAQEMKSWGGEVKIVPLVRRLLNHAPHRERRKPVESRSSLCLAGCDFTLSISGPVIVDLEIQKLVYRRPCNWVCSRDNDPARESVQTDRKSNRVWIS